MHALLLVEALPRPGDSATKLTAYSGSSANEAPVLHYGGVKPYKRSRMHQISRLTGEQIFAHAQFQCPSAEGLLGTNDASSVDVSANLRNGSPVLYLHFHKAGGSAMCDLAHLNSERISGSAVNCNFQEDDAHVDRRFTGISCDERLAKQRREGLTWMGLERWVDREMCTNFFYVTMLREPLDRMVSNVHQIWNTYPGRKTNFSWVKPEDIMSWVTPGKSVFYYTEFMEVSTAAYDNFYIRTLCGADVFFLPAGSVTREHLEKAKEVLRCVREPHLCPYAARSVRADPAEIMLSGRVARTGDSMLCSSSRGSTRTGSSFRS